MSAAAAMTLPPRAARTAPSDAMPAVATPSAVAPAAATTSPVAPSDAVATRGLTKRYGDVPAVDGLDLHVRRGEIYGLLGRNGAGKTTTIRMLLGLIRPSAGEVEVLGRRVRQGANEVFARVGYLVETATAYPNLTVRENLDIQRRLTGAPRTAIAQVIELMRLGGCADRRARVLSLGNRQRLSLARALLHRPELLILDEPANALDPSGIVEIRRLLRSLAGERGVTVLMSSHILAEVAHLADRIGIVHEGRLLEELDHDQLRARERLYVSVGVSEPERAAALLAAAGFARVERTGRIERIERAERVERPERVERVGGRLRVFGAEEHVARIARTLIDAGIDLTELTPVHEDLESYFLRLTGDVARETAADATQKTVEDAAQETAGDAARETAGDAARETAGDAARETAEGATGDTSGDAR